MCRLSGGGFLDPPSKTRWDGDPHPRNRVLCYPQDGRLRLPPNGFTLLEVMVALAIIAVAFVALLGLRNRDIALHEYGRSLITATALAQQRMADTTVAGFPDLGQSEGAFEDEYTRFRWRQEVNTTPFDFVREVRVTVLWGPTPREDQVELVGFLFQQKT